MHIVRLGGKLCGFIEPSAGNCMPSNRSDKTSVIFKEINNMEIKNNQLTIDIPEGMKIDLENSDLAKGVVKFKQSTITYEDVEDALMLCIHRKDIVVHENNASKLVALSRLMNIAKYYNRDWKPKWRDYGEKKNFIYYNYFQNEYNITADYRSKNSNAYFKNVADAQAVIDNPNFRPILDAIYKD